MWSSSKLSGWLRSPSQSMSACRQMPHARFSACQIFFISALNCWYCVDLIALLVGIVSSQVLSLVMSESVKAESLNGSIEFLGNGVIIKTKGTTSTVPLSRVQSVEFKKAGMMAGYLKVNVAGADDVQARNKTTARQQDTHTVQFSKASRNAQFEAVADAINRALLSS